VISDVSKELVLLYSRVEQSEQNLLVVTPHFDDASCSRIFFTLSLFRFFVK
jgi:hypothetical protein